MDFLAKLFGGSVLGGVKDLIGKFKLDPETKAKIELAFEENKHEALQWEFELKQKAMDLEIRAIESVNQTMREEAKSEHLAQWAWRPTVGFTFSGVIINNYILLPYLAKYGLQPIVIPGEVWTTILVVLGAAAATRGWQKVEEAKK